MAIMPGAEPFSHDGGDVGVVLCHGYPSTPQSLRAWAEYLAERGYTVRLPRLPGMGTRWQDLNKTRWTDWYGAIEDARGDLTARCRTIFAGGLSMGGLLAAKLAIDHPDVAGLVLVNPIFTHDSPALPLLPYLRRIVPFFPGIAGDIAKAGVTELAYSVNPLQAMYSQTLLWRIVTEQLPLLRTPVLLLHSREDHVVPAKSWQLFLQRIASSDVTSETLENSYHVATLDNDAPLIFERSDAFFRRLSAPVAG